MEAVMKVFLAGATGAVGRSLVPLLIERGHDVVAMIRNPEKAPALWDVGAEVVEADALDREAVIAAVVRAEPEVLIHQLTALSGATDFKRFDETFAVTNRLRTDGLDNLIAGARAAGARRVIAQSFGNWNYARTGGPVKTEEDPLDPNPPKAMRQTMAGIRYLESALAAADGIEGVALRYGMYYGPETGLGDEAVLDQVRKRRLPIVGNGAGVWSLVHIDDAANAAALAVDRGEPGIYNISDDEPAPVAEILSDLADALGAKPPRRVPVWLGRLVAGEAGVSLFTKIRGASNAKARRALGWELLYPSWRQGFRTGLERRVETPRSIPSRCEWGE
jgi:nucleoside-diphosphate-sugar epimerase